MRFIVALVGAALVIVGAYTNTLLVLLLGVGVMVCMVGAALAEKKEP